MRLEALGFALTTILVGSSLTPSADAQLGYTLFESGHVRPIAMSPDGSRLFVCNTPDGYLEIYDLTTDPIVAIDSVPVGLEPVSVAARNNDEVWVINHLSDSISIVDGSLSPPRVVRTLLVGDEPRDIVFAGPGGDRAFITTAHRGQNTPWPDGDYATPGIGRADVWVFDANNLGTSMGGNPLSIVTLFGDKPRALAATPDGSRVYGAVFRSGNQTVAVQEGLVCDGAGPCSVQGTTYPGGRPLPETNFQGIPSRETGIIVGFNGATSTWRDELDRNWNNAVRFSIPDLDVFEIDANASAPVELGSVPGVGTVLFNMIVNPATGDVYVTNTEANNRVRFEGVGDYVSDIGSKPSGDPPSVRGHIHKARITVLDASADDLLTPATEFNVLPRHLNKHIPYGASPVPAGVKEKSLATPLQMAITSDGSTLYVAGFGSNGVGVYDTAQLKNDTFVPNAATIIPIDGPSGLVLDEARSRLYVTSRMNSWTWVYDTNAGASVQLLFQHTPEPFATIRGRELLYDATKTSSNGEASCGSCHVFGDIDDLSWDLGDPDAIPFPNPNPSPPTVDFPPINDLQPFDPLKGPMTTQSLRGMGPGPLHWRGDRTDGGDPVNVSAAFTEFNVAFGGLLGRDEGGLSEVDLDNFTTFALGLTYPPNPIRALDNSLTPQQQAGRDLYTGRVTDQVANCNGCHELDRSQGFFGTGGGSTFEAETMEFKVPHLRNAYQKVGMFGQAPSGFFPAADGAFMGDQVRSTGYLHDGSVATVFDFLSAGVFSLDPGNPRPETERRALEAFIMAFDSDLAPIVGQQITLSDTNSSQVINRIDLLMERADAVFEETGKPECDLTVKGVVNGEHRGWFYQGSNLFRSDKTEPLWTKSELLAEASVPGQPLTFTCAPPGSGFRIGINRDRDANLDGEDVRPDVMESTCSASPAGGSEDVGSSALLAMTVALIAFQRRRRSATRV